MVLFVPQVLLSSVNCQTALALMRSTAIPLEQGFAKIKFVSVDNLSQFRIPEEKKINDIKAFCQKLQTKFLSFHWKNAPCGDVTWKAKYYSVDRSPLIYAEFGQGTDTTLFLGGVHPDEYTPIHLAFKFARYLKDNPNIYMQNDIKVVVAPLVNPDGFFLDKPLRTNKLVDVNRNFLTMDWYDSSHKSWAGKKSSRTRYFPGYFPNTEIETFFQIQLIDEYSPAKIFSVHAPLGFLDYDGPGDQYTKIFTDKAKTAKKLVKEVSRKAQNYRIMNYSFYPGSLGNYAGKERDIPSLTLELETTQPSKVKQHWSQFLPGFLHTINESFSGFPRELISNSTNFYRFYTNAFNGKS